MRLGLNVSDTCDRHGGKYIFYSYENEGKGVPVPLLPTEKEYPVPCKQEAE
jgi:hypothetical protein